MKRTVPSVAVNALVAAGRTVAVAGKKCAAVEAQAVASLDGRPLRVAEASSPGSFDLVSPQGSKTMTPGTHTMVAWGLWAGPIALAKGHHTLSFAGRAGTFTTTVTYVIKVG